MTISTTSALTYIEQKLNSAQCQTFLRGSCVDPITLNVILGYTFHKISYVAEMQSIRIQANKDIAPTINLLLYPEKGDVKA